MKKYLLLLTSAALLLAGCAKELVSNGVSSRDGELTKVTFTANLDNGVATKAVADGDGAAASVNRCIMEIYYGGELFAREYAPVNEQKKATFTVQVVSNRTYTVAFWADKVDDAVDSLATDKYYITNAEGLGLKAVALNGAYIGNDDARDAFFHTGTYTVAQAGSSWGDIKLKRPFAQMNVITTDWDKAASVTGLAPEKVNVTLKNALVNFNAVTGEASGSQTLTYEAAVYTAPDPVDPVSTTEKTLSMDYLFASDTKALIDIDWKALHGTDADVEHAFAAVPYQRNYRTNIKGDLLTTQGQWTVTVDPDWELDPNGDFDYAYTSVYDIQGANDFVAQNQDKKEISVTFSTQPNDAGDPSEGTDEHPINAIVTSLLKEGATYNIDVATTTDKLYVGDYNYSQEGGIFTYDYHDILPENSDKTKTAAVNLVVTDNLYIGTLVVNSPSKSVSINGQTVQSGKTYHIENLQVQEVSMNTVIIESGMVVENLEMIKGGLEIHGTVHKAIVPDNHGEIAVRDCENLDETLVYNVLKPYIAEGYAGVKGRTTADKWDIIPAVCKIGTKSYGSLIDAVAAVQSGETINLVRDYEGDGVVVPGGKNFTLDFGGHTYKVIGNMAGSAGTQNQCFQLLKGSTLVFQNGTITTSCAKLGINTYSDITIRDLTIDMTGTEATGQVACLETCNGNVSIEGNTNLIAKEGQIATLVLYWPNGVYGDINLTMNTTGEVSGLMAYGSYQVQDLSTVAQHSHVAIKNGKYDVTFDMDGLESYDYVISGGVFSEKPDDSFAPRGCAFVANTDATTSAKYPWKVGPKALPGSGTVNDPYQIASAEDLCAMASYSPYTNYILTSDITTSAQDYTKSGTYFGKGLMQQLSGIFDGNGHTITFPEGEESFYICSILYKGTIKNLNVVFPEEGSLVEISFNNSKFENVNVGGKLLHFNGNCGAYVTYAYYDVTFENCTCSADITGVGGYNDYNAVFVGYSVSSPGPFVFKNCKYTGKMVTGRSAMFLGNPNSRTINMTVENCSNEGTIISTYVASGYKMNYYYAVSGNNYDAFNINGVSHPGTASDQSWVPTCQEDNLVVTTGKAINGPIDSGMAITKNGDNQFIVTPATGGAIGGTAVAKYTVYSGLYVGVVNGSSRFFATEDITPNGSGSYITTMKDYKFVDHTYVNGGTITRIGDNDTFTDETGTYYVVESGQSTGGHQPEAATMHYVAAYDAQGRLLASVSIE